MPSSYGKDGDMRYDFYQKIISIGSSSPEVDFELKSISTDWYIEDFGYYASLLPDDDEACDYDKEIREHGIRGAKLLSKSTDNNIVACGQRYYQIIDPRDGDGEWVTKIYWKHPVISNYLNEIIDIDIANEV